MGTVSWADFGEGSTHDQAYPDACKFLRENYVFEVESAKALINRKHLEIFCSRFQSTRYGFELEGADDADYWHAQGGPESIWSPVFEDWKFAPEDGEKFESSAARWYCV